MNTRTETSAEIAETIINLERAALERWGRGDPSGFLEISAEDVVYFDPFQQRRLNGIAELRALYHSVRGKIQITRFELIDPHVQAVDDMAVLTFNYVAEGTNEATSRWNCTEAYRHAAPDRGHSLRRCGRSVARLHRRPAAGIRHADRSRARRRPAVAGGGLRHRGRPHALRSAGVALYGERPTEPTRRAATRSYRAGAALLGSAIVTTAFHAGFREFQGPQLIQPVIGNLVSTIAYLLSGNALAPMLAHVIMHVAAVLHGAATTSQLPPHY